MAVILKDESGTYPSYKFSFSKEDKACFLYLCDFESSVWIRRPSEIFTLEYVAGTNIDNVIIYNDGGIRLYPKNYKKGSAVLKVSLCSTRGSINSSSVYQEASPIAFNEYLGNGGGVDDVLSSTVQRVSVDIFSALSEKERINPYMRAYAIFWWMKRNISYSIVPKKILDSVASWIAFSPAEKRRDVYFILSSSFNLRQDYLRRIAERIYIPSRITEPFEVARYIMTEFNSMWRILQLSWMSEEATSASKTLEDGMGKCVGIANTFVALCRSVGIPARTIGGNVKTSTGERGGHQWAIIYLAPYGWLEVDPTCGEYFEDFFCEDYQYEFLDMHFNGEADIIARERV